MKSKKIILIIISAVLCLALIFGGIAILSGRNKKKNEKTDGQEKNRKHDFRRSAKGGYVSGKL